MAAYIDNNAKSRRQAHYRTLPHHNIHMKNTRHMYINNTLLNKTDRIRGIVTAISSSQRSLSPFWFQLLTIFSVSASFIGRDFYQRQLLVFRIVKIKIIIVTLITSYTNLATLKPDTRAPVQTRFFTYTLQ